MTQTPIKDSVKWWDHKRIWYNIIVGTIGMGYIIHIYPSSFGMMDIIGILLYGFGANILFSLGILLELYDYTYRNNAIGFRHARLLFFIIGTGFSVLYTIFQIEVYYFGPLAAG